MARRDIFLACLAGLLLVGAFGVRLHGIGEPLIEFHALRHYRSALIARACFDDRRSATPAWARLVADANRDVQPAGEPPIGEALVCAVDLAQGRENPTFPRVLSAMWWTLGAIPLGLLIARFASKAAVLVGLALFLFLPYGVVATRSFQPDALMTMCALWGIECLLRAHDAPTWPRIVLAGGAAGFAMLVKPMSVFLVAPVAVAFGLWTPLAIALVPAGLFYGWSAVAGTLVKDQMSTRFVPSLMSTAFFWHGWATQIGRVIGWPTFIAALVGTAVAPPRARRLLLALWAGYGLFAFAFTYHIPTHDYYHLPYVAVASLATAALAQRLLARAGPRGRWPIATATALAIALWGTVTAWPALSVPHASEIVATYEHIGEVTGHDTRVLFLDLEYGYPLMYHGQMAGDEWPNTDDLAAEQIGGRPAMTAPDRFARGYAAFRPNFFVVTDLDSLAAETDLQGLLAERAVLIDTGPTFRIYRFRDPHDGTHLE